MDKPYHVSPTTLSERNLFRLLNVAMVAGPPLLAAALQPLFVGDVVAQLGQNTFPPTRDAESLTFQKPSVLPWSLAVAYRIQRAKGLGAVYSAWKITAATLLGTTTIANLTKQIVERLFHPLGDTYSGIVQLVSQVLPTILLAPLHFTETVDIWNQINDAAKPSVLSQSFRLCLHPGLITITMVDVVLSNLVAIAQYSVLARTQTVVGSDSLWPKFAEICLVNLGGFLITSPISVIRRRLELRTYLSAGTKTTTFANLRDLLFPGEAQASWSGLFKSSYPAWDIVVFQILIGVLAARQYQEVGSR